MKLHHRSGQAMLIAVLTIGGTILSATTIAGFLMLYQLRASTDSENSAKAIFAADAGTEWTLFDYYCSPEGRCPSVVPGRTDYESSTLAAAFKAGSGATVSVACSNASGTPTLCSDATNTVSAIAWGSSSDSRRAFLLTLATTSPINP